MRNVLLLPVTIVTCALANVCSNNGARGSTTVCRNASLENLMEIPRYTYRIKFADSSNIKNIPENSFAEYYELKSLSIVNCSVDNVESFAFRSLSKLKTLNLSRNALTYIKENVFSGLRSLEKLDLTHNMIAIIEEGSFRNVSNIGLLDLRHNNLTRIFVTVLRPLSKASTLDLRFNNLRCVSLEKFEVTRLKWFYIGDNPWDEGCWANLTQFLYNSGVYYGKNQAFDTLTEDRLSWNASYQGGRDLLSEHQAEEEASIVKEAEGWKEFYETIVREIAEERQRIEDLAMAAKEAKESEEILLQQNNERKNKSGFLQFGRDLIMWILSVCRIFPIFSIGSETEE
ncbi:slit homolog 2 protein-like [Athalia rosae]|uniref:slit homolog 2 protein-like n=1 Tax=Athalia rosae TaxID=37344 RepID=UPI002033785B|nr:slit homolog 2 protein-like [Athalia rosae]